MPTDPDSVSSAIDAATAAIIESSPWLREAIERDDAHQDDETARSVLAGTSLSPDSLRRRTAFLSPDAGTCPPGCQCSPLLHWGRPRVSLYKPRNVTYPSGSIRHFPTCATCGNSYPDGRPCH